MSSQSSPKPAAASGETTAAPTAANTAAASIAKQQTGRLKRKGDRDDNAHAAAPAAAAVTPTPSKAVKQQPKSSPAAAAATANTAAPTSAASSISAAAAAALAPTVFSSSSSFPVSVVKDATKGWVSRALADIASGASFVEAPTLQVDCAPGGKDRQYLAGVLAQAKATCPSSQSATPLSWYCQQHFWKDEWDEGYATHIVARLVLICRLLKHPFPQPLHYHPSKLEEGLNWNQDLNCPGRFHRVHAWLTKNGWLSASFSAKDVGQAFLQVHSNQRIARTGEHAKARIMLFAEHARLSHSCVPNCHSFVRRTPDATTMVIVALRDIPAGDELTIAYGGIDRLPRAWADRQQHVMKRCNFQCACSACKKKLDFPEAQVQELVRLSNEAETNHNGTKGVANITGGS